MNNPNGALFMGSAGDEVFVQVLGIFMALCFGILLLFGVFSVLEDLFVSMPDETPLIVD